MMPKALITGITGQDGSHLAELLLAKGYGVCGMVRRASTENFQRIEHLKAAQAGHFSVEQHQIGRRLARQAQRILPVGGKSQVARVCKDAAQYLDRVRVVVDQQDVVIHDGRRAA